ncbi:unnamed protein product, partial [Rotaria sordida]
MSEPLEPK